MNSLEVIAITLTSTIAVLGVYGLTKESHEDRWRRGEIQKGKHPAAIENEVVLRKEIAAMRNFLSDKVALEGGENFEALLDAYLSATCQQLERQQLKLGKAFLAIVEGLDLADILTPTALAIIQTKKENIKHAPADETDHVVAAQIDRAAFRR